MPSVSRVLLTAAIAVASLATLPTQAQLFRAYLSPTGSDAAPCTLAAPCRLLPAALAAVATGGEVWILGAANYNTTTVTIDKPVTVMAVPGVVGSLVANGAPAVNVVGSGSSPVVLRGLAINQVAGTPLSNGIVASSVNGPVLVIEDCTFTRLGTGLLVDTTAMVSVARSTFTGNATGIMVQRAFQVTVTSSHFIENGSNGIRVTLVGDNETAGVSVSHSHFQRNNVGVAADATGPGQAARVGVYRSSFLGHLNVAVLSNGAGSNVLLSDSGAFNNFYGAGQMNGGLLRSTGDNSLDGNTNPPFGDITLVSKR